MRTVLTLWAFDLQSNQTRYWVSASRRTSRFSTQLLHPWSCSFFYWRHWGIIQQKAKCRYCFCRYFSGIWHVWHRGLTVKLLRTIPSKEMVKAIMGMISQRCFHVHIGKSKLRCWNILSGAPQGSVIAPALFNLFTYDIPATVSRKYIYADDTALMASDTCFLVVDQTFSDDLDKLRNCFYSWQLKFNTTKTVCSTFHVTNGLANYELSMRESHSIKLQSISVTLWPCTLLPPTLTKHRSKVSKRCNLMKKLASNQ